MLEKKKEEENATIARVTCSSPIKMVRRTFSDPGTRREGPRGIARSNNSRALSRAKQSFNYALASPSCLFLLRLSARRVFSAASNRPATFRPPLAPFCFPLRCPLPFWLLLRCGGKKEDREAGGAEEGGKRNLAGRGVEGLREPRGTAKKAAGRRGTDDKRAK